MQYNVFFFGVLGGGGGWGGGGVSGDNVSRIWSICGYRDVRYVSRGMCKYT